jgi:tetratricopeptide (TPR) repeat protein
VAVTCNNLAALAHARGNDAEAERLYQRALAIKEKLLDPDHPDVVMTLNNLAVLYKSGGKYAEAELLYQRALVIFEMALGPTHPQAVTCRRNAAQLRREVQRRTKTVTPEASAKRGGQRRSRRSGK